MTGFFGFAPPSFCRYPLCALFALSSVLLAAPSVFADAPLPADTQTARGTAYARLGDYAHAEAAYSAVLVKSPQSTQARKTARARRIAAQKIIAYATRKLQKPPQATFAPVSETLHLRRGFALYNTGQYAKALADYNVVLGHDEANAAAYVGRALVYVAREEWQKAASDYRQAFLLRPDALPQNAGSHSHDKRPFFHLLLQTVEPACENKSVME